MIYIMKPMTFKKELRVKAPVEEVFEWHERTGALERLSPPWDPLEVITKGPGIEKGTRVEMKIKARKDQMGCRAHTV